MTKQIFLNLFQISIVFIYHLNDISKKVFWNTHKYVRESL